MNEFCKDTIVERFVEKNPSTGRITVVIEAPNTAPVFKTSATKGLGNILFLLRSFFEDDMKHPYYGKRVIQNPTQPENSQLQESPFTLEQWRQRVEDRT